MKKLFYSLLCTTTLLFGATSCLKDKGPTVLELLQGQWVCYAVGDNILATDSISVVAFNYDMSFGIAAPFTNSMGQTHWMEHTDLTYTLEGATLTMTSEPSSSTQIEIKVQIDLISYNQLVYTVESWSVNGVEQGKNQEMSFINASTNVVSNMLPGAWSMGLEGDSVALWAFSTGGLGELYNYYLYDDATSTYLESYTAGYDYYVYGTYVVLEEPDPTSAGRYYRAWSVENISYSGLIWSNTSQSGVETISTLYSISELPPATSSVPSL